MAITPAKYNITLQRRADFRLDIRLKDSTGAEINLTGWTAYAQIWNRDRSAKHGDFTVTYTNRATGELGLTLSSTTTTTLPEESYYDLLLQNPSMFKEYYLEGVIYTSEGFTSPS